MLLGWMQANSVGRYVKVDAKFPHPALHHGRSAMRRWAEWCGKSHSSLGRDYAGPIRWAMLVGDFDAVNPAVGELSEHVDLRIWPVAREMQPRRWNERDLVWREALNQLREYVGRDLKCCTRLEWMPGEHDVVRFKTAPTLLGINHFFGWRRGEFEPSRRLQRDLTIIRRAA